MRRVLPLLVLTFVLAAARAEALSIRDIIDLCRAGLGEEILLALIEVDRRVFPIDAATLKQLKDGGVPERVILAIVRSGRVPPLEPPPASELPAPAPQPQVIVIDHDEPPTTIVREVAVPVAVPVYVPIFRSRRPHVQIIDAVLPRVDTTPRYRTDTIPHAPIGLPHPRLGLSPEQKNPEPVYWGWGGKLRPDAWKPD